MIAAGPVHPGAAWTVFAEWRATQFTPVGETAQRHADWRTARNLALQLVCLRGTRYVTLTAPGGWVVGAWDEYTKRWREYPCCDMHNRHCEPPGDLCCGRCTEAAHDTFPIRHADGTACVLDQTAKRS